MSLSKEHAIHYYFLNIDKVNSLHQWLDELPLEPFIQIHKRLLDSETIKDKILLVKTQKDFLSRIKSKIFEIETQDATAKSFLHRCSNYVAKSESELSLPHVPCEPVYKKILHAVGDIESYYLRGTNEVRRVYGDSTLFSIWYTLAYPNNPVVLPFHFDKHPLLRLPALFRTVPKDLQYLYMYTYRTTQDVIELLKHPRPSVEHESAEMIYRELMRRESHDSSTSKFLSKEEFDKACLAFEQTIEKIIEDCRSHNSKMWVSRFADHTETE